MTDWAIDTQKLTKHYGDVVAVQDLDLQVTQGEIFGFLGPNGAGKTTTIRTLLDQIRPTSGAATILGRDVHRDALEIRRLIGYVPGDLALYPRLTGKETLQYFARLRGGVEQSYIDELAERLKADLSRKVGDYSTGNRQKIGLIQAFMHSPALLVLDEPTAGLDPLIQQEFHAMLEEVRDEGRTVFLSSHSLSQVERVADRVGIIREGRLVVVEGVDDLKRKAIRRIDFEFADPIPSGTFTGVAGVHEASVERRHATVSFEGPVNDILRAAMAHEVLNLNSRESDLEEVFLTYYRDAVSPGGNQEGKVSDVH
ncbi:ABC transporter ATP-binding protein [Rhodococcus xishaensis]|uniref:ABC transporter ATP-binding protein n=1 Tax=Rhodococcus xishaensis TaxID=2487364 RepID=A0A438ARQ2_9NOCA|nr:ABC transporter ATP-binding protein [Rhodococcus xishaensis]RVW01375.1 ABC transporter ATP-binding protein [Rhodococcus xishaensis]